MSTSKPICPKEGWMVAVPQGVVETRGAVPGNEVGQWGGAGERSHRAL